MTIADHYSAFKAQLAGGILSGNVFDVVRYSGGQAVRDNYAVLRPSAPKRDNNRYTSPNRITATSLFRYDVRYVATSVAGVLQWQQAGQERLIPDGGVRLIVPGRKCDPIRLVEPVEEGEYSHDATANLFFVDETYEFWSRRAA